MITVKAVCVAIGYCFGMILVGYILGKIAHKDLKSSGSGNVGTTNATRVLGKKSGLITLLCDVLKAVAAAFVVYFIFRGSHPGDVRLLMCYGAFGAMLGHDFPVYMGFKGGKGVATGIAFMGIAVPPAMPVCVVEFVIVVALTKYVSLGSVIGCVVAVVSMFVFGHMGVLPYTDDQLIEVYILVCIAALITIIKHHENIGRLLRGEENKFKL